MIILDFLYILCKFAINNMATIIIPFNILKDITGEKENNIYKNIPIPKIFIKITFFLLRTL